MNKKNPFQYLRQLAGISQLGMAKMTGMSRSTIVYIETGQYPHLSQYMIDCLYDACQEKGIDPTYELEHEYGVWGIEAAYGKWCRVMRQEARHKFTQVIDMDEVILRTNENLSPFAAYVEYVAGSKQKFCKMLKVSDAAVFRYSKGEAKTMPQTIEDALREVGFPYLDEIKEAQEQWLSQFPS